MSGDNGYNPLRWDCERDGCYNKECRPKIEIFADCFPGRINFGDVDAGIVEINSRALLLEWKSNPIPIPAGQHSAYMNLSRTGLLVALAVAGNAKTMEVVAYSAYVGGNCTGWRNADQEKIKGLCRRWAARAQELPPIKLRPALPDERITLRDDLKEWVADYAAHQHEFDALLRQ